MPRTRRHGAQAPDGGKRGFILGAIGLSFLGWAGAEHLQGAQPEVPAALSEPAEGAAAGAGVEAGADVPASPCEAPGLSQARERAAADQLGAALARLPESGVAGLLELRALALAGGASGRQAAQALAAERRRGLADAGEATDEAGLRALTRAYLATVDPAPRRALRERIHAAGRTVLCARRPRTSDLLQSYTVVRGDALARIARRHGTDYRLIKQLNRMKSDGIRIGQRLNVPRAKVEVLIFKRDFELVVLLGDCLLRSFDVATGKDGKTPVAEFTIDSKLIEPDWTSPIDKKVYPYGSEENILGTRWLGFANTDEHAGFGIHGTRFPESIGTESSLGCIRLRNAEVEELFELVPMRTRVRIVP